MQDESKVIQDAILFLESRGYTVTPPAEIDIEVHDPYTFERAWDLYQKKVGPKEKLKAKWYRLSMTDRKAAIEYIPEYVKATADRTYRKNFQTFLNQRGWEDEIIPHHENRNRTKLDAMQTIVNQRLQNAAESDGMEKEVFDPFKVPNDI